VIEGGSSRQEAVAVVAVARHSSGTGGTCIDS